MGAAAVKQFVDEPIESGTLTGTMGKCISSAAVSTAPMKIKVKSNAMNKSSQLIDESTGETLYTCSASLGFMKLTVTVTDKDGSLVAVATGKDGFSEASFRVLKPSPAFKGQPAAPETGPGEEALYPFAKCDLIKGMLSCTAKYNVTKGDEEGQPLPVPLYEAKKIKALTLFLLRVENMDGHLVAKCGQPKMTSNSVVIEVGAGVDIVAVALLSTFVGVATTSAGGGVGGVVGAGAI